MSETERAQTAAETAQSEKEFQDFAERREKESAEHQKETPGWN